MWILHTPAAGLLGASPSAAPRALAAMRCCMSSSSASISALAGYEQRCGAAALKQQPSAAQAAALAPSLPASYSFHGTTQHWNGL